MFTLIHFSASVPVVAAIPQLASSARLTLAKASGLTEMVRYGKGMTTGSFRVDAGVVSIPN